MIKQARQSYTFFKLLRALPQDTAVILSAIAVSEQMLQDGDVSEVANLIGDEASQSVRAAVVSRMAEYA